METLRTCLLYGRPLLVTRSITHSRWFGEGGMNSAIEGLGQVGATVLTPLDVTITLLPRENRRRELTP